MATLEDAELARSVSAENLRRLGAHSISVEEADEEPLDGRRSVRRGKKDRSSKHPSFAVVAWFEDEPPESLPEELEITHAGRTKSVPLKARREDRFQPE